MSTSEDDAPTLRWAVLALLGLLMFGSYYGYDAIAPLAEILGRELGFTDTQIGGLNAIYSAPNVVMVLVGGVLVDRIGLRRVILGTSIVLCAGAFLTAARPDYAMMAAGRLLFGLGAETMIIAATTAIGLWFAKKHLALAMAIAVSLARAGSYAADVSPAWAPELYAAGWRPPLLVAAGFSTLGLVGAVGYLFVARRAELGAKERAERFEWRTLLKLGPRYYILVATCVLFYATIFPFRSTFAVKYYQHAHGLSLEDASTTNGIVFLTAVVATPIFGALVDRLGRHRAWLVGGALVLLLAFVLLLTRADPRIATALLGISFALVPAVLWPAVALTVEPHRLGTAYGLMAMLQNLGLTAANVIAGQINDASGAGAADPGAYRPMLLFFTALALGAAVTAGAGLIRGRRETIRST